MALNLIDKFNDTAIKYPDRIAIQYKKNNEWASVSYSNFKNCIESLSAFLSQKHVEKGDKVAILLENRFEWPLIFFAVVSLGAVCVPLNTESDKKEIESILKNSETKIVFTGSGALLDKAKSCKCTSLVSVVSVDCAEFKKAIGSSGQNSSHADGADHDDLACLLYTSGTTDEPKGVMLSHKNLLSNVDSIRRINIFTLKDSAISILPLHHVFPLTGTMLLPLLCGGKIIYPESIRPEILFETMQDTNPTFFVAVPQIFYSIHQNIKGHFDKMRPSVSILLKIIIEFLYKVRKRTKINLTRFLLGKLHKRFGKSMRLLVSGGAKLNEEVEEALFKLGFTIIEGYGLTETSPILTVNSLQKPKIGSVGFPVPDVDLKLKNKNQQGVGEVVVRGPNIMQGYYKRDDLTSQVIKDGWFHTGDLGVIDEEGYLFITGRAKEVIVLSSGLNIYPDEIEEAYVKDVPIKEMCVFDVPTKRGGKEGFVLWAAIVPDLEFFKKYGEMNLRNVIKERLDNVSRNLPPFKRIMGFSITLEEFPRTLLGKMKRFAIKELYTPQVTEKGSIVAPQKELSKEDKEFMKDEVSQKIIDYLKKETKVENIVPADLLELDLGIDSLGRVELASGLEKLFNIEIEDEKVTGVFTVRDLIEGIKRLLDREPKVTTPGDAKQKQEETAYWRRLLGVLPKEENLKMVDIRPGFGAWLFGIIFVSFTRVFFKIFYRLKVEGRENVPNKGPCIFYANHISFYDGFIAVAAIPPYPRLDLFFLGFRPYFNVPIVRNFVKVGRIVPLDFVSHLIEALKVCYYVLNNDRCICLFPEGMRTLDGEVGEFKKGFGILAKESKATLVPLYIEGAYEAWPRTAKFPKLHPIKVKIGKPLDIGEIQANGYNQGAKDDYEAVCLAAREILKKLK